MRFILSDETPNRYGYIVRTAGIKLDQFQKNPVMLYNHDRWSMYPIGTWKNLKVEGTTLSGEPEFDDSDEESVVVSQKVKKGVLNATSIGIEVLKWEYQPAESDTDPNAKILVVTESNLIEVSIVDIPANANATRLRFNCAAPKEFFTPPQKKSMNLNFKKGWTAILALVGIAADMPVEESHLETLNVQLGERNERIVQLSAKIETLQAKADQLTAVQTRVAELETQLQLKTTAFDTANTQVATLSAQVTKLATEREELSNKILTMSGNPTKIGTDADPRKQVKTLNYE